MEFLLAYFATVLFGLATDIGGAWDALPELPDPWNLGLGKRRFGLIVLAADIFGIGLSLLRLAVGTGSWIYIPIALCLALTLFALVSLVVNRWGWLPAAGQGHEARFPLSVAKLAALAGVFVGAFIVGTLFGASDNSEPVVRWSPYHVEGTTANGSGFLNECPEPSPCAGKNPVGRLYEGDPVYIECQIIGDVAESQGGQASRIWDRLYSGAFVSDLFVTTRGTGRLSKGLPHCTDWK